MVRLFHKLFPDVAERELRAVQIRDDGKAGDVPAGEYVFVESYCTNPYCNCERVIISVVERRLGILASISYDLNPSGAPTYAGRPNPCLEPGIDQSKYAGASLALVQRTRSRGRIQRTSEAPLPISQVGRGPFIGTTGGRHDEPPRRVGQATATSTEGGAAQESAAVVEELHHCDSFLMPVVG